MKIKYTDLTSMLKVIHEGLIEVGELDSKYTGCLATLDVLSRSEFSPPFVLSYRTFKTNQEFEEFQKENVIIIHNVIPIYSNFDSSQEAETEMRTIVTEPYIMVTYHHVSVDNE